MLKVLVTGSSGFVGRQLIAQAGYQFVPVSRYGCGDDPIPVGDFLTFNGWQQLFQGVDVVVHLAAKVQQPGSASVDYEANNVALVKRVAQAALAAGVKRLVFVSSIKVNGERTDGVPFTANDTPRPQDAYALSKLRAEEFLLGLAQESRLEVVVIRPPLVYGPGVKANFNLLFKLAKLPFPLPFAAINNRRDMVSVYNLCDLIVKCIEHPNAKNQLLLVSDGQPYALSQLMTLMRASMGRKAGLLPCPRSLLRFFFCAIGKKQIASRLLDDLEVDISHTEALLGWRPLYSIADTLRKMRP